MISFLDSNAAAAGAEASVFASRGEKKAEIFRCCPVALPFSFADIRSSCAIRV